MPYHPAQSADRIIARCREIAACTEVPGETTRTFLSPPMHEVHALLRGWMEAAGMAVHIDSIGNIHGLFPGLPPDAPRLLIASHLDTVPNAGAFDGILGVVLGLAIIEELRGQHLPFAIEVIGFSEEDGVRFSKPFLGSLALTGALSAQALALTDKNDLTLEQAIRNFGLDPAQIPSSPSLAGAFAYLEVHIEQGPVLESEASPLAVVSDIAGQTRIQLTFEGKANHAGTTPMHLRHDAMAAAAEWIVAVEACANENIGLLATVGKVETFPGAGNVIAARVAASLDVRHRDDHFRESAVLSLVEIAKSASTKRGVNLTLEIRLEQSAVAMDPGLVHLLSTAAAKAGFPSRLMTSGAGHDAMIVAEHIPSTMLFLRSPGGLSHHPDESVLPHDVAAALSTAMEFLVLLRDDRSDTPHIQMPKDDHA